MLLASPPQNMIAQSQSGTGKTAAFVLAMLSRVDTTKNYVQVRSLVFSMFSICILCFVFWSQVLCLSPTYELAIQTGEVAAKMSQHCKDIQLRFAVRGEEGNRSRFLNVHNYTTNILLQFLEIGNLPNTSLSEHQGKYLTGG